MTESLSVIQGRLYGNALQAASSGGHDQVVQMLLDKGANINAQGGEYGIALQAASELTVAANSGHLELVKLLLDKGPDIFVANADGWTALNPEVVGPEHTSIIITVNNLGIFYIDQGKLTEAEKMYQRALEGFEKAWGPDHISTLRTVNNLGNLYVD